MIGLLFALSFAVASPADEEAEEYPAEFQGVWAPTAAACKSEDGAATITIGKTKIWTYEADSKLLKITPIMYFTAPAGAEAKSIHALVAERGEMEVGTGKLRLTLSGGKLYTSRIDEVSEDAQWKYGHVRCP